MIRPRGLAAVLGVVLALAGCTVGPDYERPAVPVAGAWRNAPAGESQAGPWWRGFPDPLLDRLEAEAMSANLDLEKSIARIDQARAGLRAANAALRPTVDASAGYARAQQSLDSGLGQLSRYVPNFGRTVDNAQGTLSASWELDFAGGIRRQGEAARARLASSGAGLAAVRLAVSAELADAYWGLRGAQAQAAALDRLVAIARDQRAIVAARVRAKSAPADALRQASAALADLEGQAPLLRAAAEAQRNRIAVLLGRDPSAAFAELDAPGVVAEMADPAAGRPGNLLQRRPDVVAAEQDLVAANAAIGSALADYYPRISLSALLGQATNHPSNLLDGSATQAQAAVGLRWRLFDFGRIDAEVRAARGRKREALAAYREAILLASESVETSFARRLALQSRLARLLDQRRALAENAASARLAFKVGETGRLEMLLAERDLARLDLDIASAQRDLAEAGVACHRALGSPTA